MEKSHAEVTRRYPSEKVHQKARADSEATRTHTVRSTEQPPLQRARQPQEATESQTA